MSMKLNAGEVGRSDLYAFYPEHIVVKHEENSRCVPHTQEEIEALANSIEEYGQQQPAMVRRIDGNRVQLVAGYGRYQAVVLLNQCRPDKPLKLQCRVVDLNAEEAFVRSIVENNERAETTPVDDAHAQRRLREDFGWSEQRIADFYKRSVAYIHQLRKVLQLSAPLQKEIGNGNLTIGAALDVVQLPEAEREKVVAEATNPETGKVNGNAIRVSVREKKQKEGEAKARTLKEVRTFFEEQTGPGENKAIRELANKILEFISGRITDRQMSNALSTYTKDGII